VNNRRVLTTGSPDEISRLDGQQRFFFLPLQVIFAAPGIFAQRAKQIEGGVVLLEAPPAHAASRKA